MKSYINSLADYRQVPIQWEVVIACPEEQLQKEMRGVVRPYKWTETVQVISKGDVALLKLESELPKLSKGMVPVTVGSNLLDRELELQLPGHAVGETFCACVQGKTVNVTVLKCSRTVFPEPTDEMVVQYTKNHEEYAGVCTVAELQRRITVDYCERQRQDAVYDAMQQILNYVLSHSDWEFDEDELQQLNETVIESERQRLLQEEGKDLDTISDEEIMRYFGIPDRERLMEILMSGNEQRIAMALWSTICRGLDPASCSLEDEETLNFDFLEAYVRDNLIYKEDV